jgi:branched-chain amino acid transport system permease protein
MSVVVTPEMIGQVVISGVLSGALYAMVALGLALIFGVMRVINIAHGSLLMLGAYVTFFLYSRAGLNPFLTVPIAMAGLFVVGVVLQRTLVFRVVDAPELSSLLLTFGISIALVNLAQNAFTSDLRAVEYITGSWIVRVPGLGRDGGLALALSKPRFIAFLFAGVVTALAFLFLKTTRLGKAIRATSQSREVAMVCGINVARIHLITFGLASALAAGGGALLARARQRVADALWSGRMGDKIEKLRIARAAAGPEMGVAVERGKKAHGAVRVEAGARGDSDTNAVRLEFLSARERGQRDLRLGAGERTQVRIGHRVVGGSVEGGLICMGFARDCMARQHVGLLVREHRGKFRCVVGERDEPSRHIKLTIRQRQGVDGR